MGKARPRGSIKKTKFGTFEVRWSYDGQDGKRKQGSKSFKTNREAQAFLTQKLAEMDGGSFIAPSKYTVAQHLDDWLERYVDRECKPNTVKSYQDAVRLYLKPMFGKIALTSLTSERIEQILAGQKEKRTAASLHRAYAILHGAMKFALVKKRLAINPCDGVTLPKIERKREIGTALDAEQVMELLRQVVDTKLYLPIFLALNTGMRIGEIAALRWEDISFEEAAIRVERTMTDIDGKIAFGTPKNGKTRVIALDEDVVEVLRQHKGRQAERRLQTKGYQDHGLVYPRHNGTPRNLRAISSTWGWLVRERGLPKVRLHDLRHTHATLLLAAKIPVEYVSKRLGHTSIDFTMRVYAKYLPSMDQEAAKALGDLLRKTTVTK